MERFCVGGGYLVDQRGWIPDQPFDFHWILIVPHIGCSHLRCELCGEVVRQVAGYVDDPQASAAEVHAALGGPVPPMLPHVRREPNGFGRLYACSCYRVAVDSDHLATEPFDTITDETTPWSCAGHPAFSLPALLDGVSLAADTDLAALAREVFTGARAVKVHPAMQALQGFWIQRLYNLLDAPLDEALALGVAGLLVDADARARIAAIRFFEVNYQAPGVTRVAEAMRDRPELFLRGVDPDGRGTIWDWMSDFLARKMREDADRGRRPSLALELIQAASIRSPGIALEIYSLATLAPRWVLDHAGEILDAAPGDWRRLLRAIEDYDEEQIADVAEEIVRRGYATLEEVIDYSNAHMRLRS